METQKFSYSETMSPLEAAEILGVSKTTVHTYFDMGLLHGYRLPGGARRISIGSVMQLHADNHQRPPRRGRR